MTQNAEIPVINIAPLFDESAENLSYQDEVGEQLKHAFEQTGLAYLCFSGESRDLFEGAIAPAMQSLRTFFRQPASFKDLSVCTHLSPGVSRGYLAPAAESGSDALEWKEGYSWSCEWHNDEKPSNCFEAYNIWPPNGASMRQNLTQAFDFMHKVTKLLSRTIAKVLNDSSLPNLESLCDAGKSLSLMRAFHYFEKDESRIATGSSSHTDWGFMTLVRQEDGTESALQVHLDGAWKDIPPLPNTLVVNCSDFLSLLTRGRLRSPQHRVELTSTERTSLVFFQYPGYNTSMPEENYVEGLSLLKDQSTRGNGRMLLTKNKRFGDFIIEKWAQVSRM
ncbi:Oxoglutarate/iron-dependent dioxygenase [Gracilaria domingensis]|nr:Oxoglutarate/iron-dependent dioxygenase [Gracilaria domingensis]